MGFFDRLFQGKARDKPDLGQSRPIFRRRADVSMTGSEAIYAAVSRISNTVASIPVHLYKGYERQRDHELERLISFAPNPSQTPFLFFQTMEAFRNTEGRAYALKIPDPAHPTRTQRLDILDPTLVQPLRDMETMEMWYQVQLDEGRSIYVPGYQMISLRHMSANGEIGIRPLDVLRGTLNYDQRIKAFSLNQLEGVNNGVVLNFPTTGVSKQRKKEIVAEFLEAYKESSGRVIVLDAGVTSSTLSQSPVDARVLDVERITKNRVATVYNIPPHMLGDYSDTSFSTAEQQMQEYLALTILPIVAQYEQEMNRKLLTYEMIKQGYGFRFSVEALARADVAAMAEKHQKAIRGGWMKPNDARQVDGLPPMPEGDQLMGSRDMLPLSFIIEHPDLLVSGKTKTDQEVA